MKTKNKKITARRVINFILELYVALSFWGMFLAGAEREDGSISLLWALGWIANAFFALYVVAPRLDTGEEQQGQKQPGNTKQEDVK